MSLAVVLHELSSNLRVLHVCMSRFVAATAYFGQQAMDLSALTSPASSATLSHSYLPVSHFLRRPPTPIATPCTSPHHHEDFGNPNGGRNGRRTNNSNSKRAPCFNHTAHHRPPPPNHHQHALGAPTDGCQCVHADLGAQDPSDLAGMPPPSLGAQSTQRRRPGPFG